MCICRRDDALPSAAASAVEQLKQGQLVTRPRRKSEQIAAQVW